MWVSGMDGASILSPVHVWLFLSFFLVEDDLLHVVGRRGQGIRDKGTKCCRYAAS